MWWFPDYWSGYLDYCQRSWCEVMGLWGLPGVAGRDLGTMPQDWPLAAWQPFLAAPTAQAWWPRVEARIEPLEAPEGEAARLSMRIFVPWGGAPVWVEALVGRDQPAPAALLPETVLPRLGRP